MNTAQPTSAIPAPTCTIRWLFCAARVLLLAWLLFWTWFIVTDMAVEGVAYQPVIGLCLVWSPGAIAWFWPRLGSLCLLGLAAWAVWFFHPGVGSALVAVPAVAVAVMLLTAARASGARPQPR